MASSVGLHTIQMNNLWVSTLGGQISIRKVESIPPNTFITLHPREKGSVPDVVLEYIGSDLGTDISNLLYQYKLVPDNATSEQVKWSKYTSLTKKTYKNLSDDTYTFYVRAVDKDENADLSPAEYTFRIDTAPPVQIIQVKFKQDGIFLANHVWYENTNRDAEVISKNLILITTHTPKDPTDIWESPLNDFAEVVSINPSESSKFKLKGQNTLQVLKINQALPKDSTLYIPPGCKLRLKMDQDGYLHDYINGKLEYTLENIDQIGRVWFKTTKDVEVNARLFLPTYTDEFKDVTDIYKIPKDSMVSISLQHLSFLNIKNIVSRASDGFVSTKIAIKARREDNIHEETMDVSGLWINGKNTIQWTDPEGNDLYKLGSFICPRDKPVKYFADTIMAMYDTDERLYRIANSAIRKALLLYTGLQAYGIAYSNDPDTSSYGEIDLIWYAREMLEPLKFDIRGEKISKSTGDCDDSTVLLATLLQAVDVQTLLILQPRHILLAFDTGIPREIAQEISIEPLGNNWYLKPEPYGRAWIPIETTMLKEGDFINAWKKGLERTKRYKELKRLSVKEAQEDYKPADLYNEDIWKPLIPSKDKIDKILMSKHIQTWLSEWITQLENVRKHEPGTATQE